MLFHARREPREHQKAAYSSAKTYESGEWILTIVRLLPSHESELTKLHHRTEALLWFPNTWLVDPVAAILDGWGLRRDLIGDSG